MEGRGRGGGGCCGKQMRLKYKIWRVGKKTAGTETIIGMHGVSWIGCQMVYHRCTLCRPKRDFRGDYFV